jgi:hypothetical protein
VAILLNGFLGAIAAAEEEAALAASAGTKSKEMLRYHRVCTCVRGWGRGRMKDRKTASQITEVDRSD